MARKSNGVAEIELIAAARGERAAGLL